MKMYNKKSKISECNPTDNLRRNVWKNFKKKQSRNVNKLGPCYTDTRRKREEDSRDFWKRRVIIILHFFTRVQAVTRRTRNIKIK